MKFLKVTYSVLYMLPESKQEQDRFLNTINNFNPNRAHAWRDGSEVGNSKIVESSLVLDEGQVETYAEKLRKIDYTNG